MKFKIFENKKILSLIGIGFILLMAYFLLKKDTNSPKTPTFKQSIKPPNIKNYFKGYKVELGTEADLADIPVELPYLKQNKLGSYTQEQAIQIASKLGFSEAPLEFNDIKFGKFYVWNNTSYSLIIYADIRKLKLSPFEASIEAINDAENKNFSDNELVSTSRQYLIENLSLDPNKTKLANIVYLKVGDGSEVLQTTTKAESEVTQTNFYYSTTNIPIYNLNGRDTQIFLNYTRDGKLLNFEANLHSDYDTSEFSYKIKTTEELKNNLNQSIVIDLNGTNTNLPDLNSDAVTSVSINKITLVYIVDELNSEFLQPVFLLEGVANTRIYNQAVPATLLLPAFSSQ